ncbi:hypothetical protein [Alteromonas profundi]|uniref:hypothetical protein n=1 Tax=Alteromonas profundi TaxID=2696062 RepID=UPI0019459300|nr:hypothetical protein [Alteromonas profundi]
MQNHAPPVSLVKTWYHLLCHAEDEKVKAHAQEMLLGAFDSPEKLKQFLLEHKVI